MKDFIYTLYLTEDNGYSADKETTIICKSFNLNNLKKIKSDVQKDLDIIPSLRKNIFSFRERNEGEYTNLKKFQPIVQNYSIEVFINSLKYLTLFFDLNYIIENINKDYTEVSYLNIVKTKII